MVDVGKVTVPPNQPVPQPNSLVKIQYLYKYERRICDDKTKKTALSLRSSASR